jgi:hypothetical protein
MQLRRERLVSLGFGRFVRSDDVTAVEPIREKRGPGRRALVWVRGLPEPLVSSRSEEAVLNDLTGHGREDASRERDLAAALEQITAALERIPAVTLRLLQAESGDDLGRLSYEARTLLSGESPRPAKARSRTPSRTEGVQRHLRDVGNG